MSRQTLTILLALAVLAILARMPLTATYLPASVGGGHGGGGGGHGKPPPVISSVKIPRVTHDSAIITWTTDKPATSKIEYWIDRITGEFKEDRTATTSHSITLTGLMASTTYTYNVYSEDEEYYYARLSNGKFTTVATPPPVPVLTATTTAALTAPSGSGATSTAVATTTLPAQTDMGAPLTVPRGAVSPTPAAASGARFPRNLSRGSRGEDVLLVQRTLIGWKFLPAGSNSGFFGSATEAGVRRLQQRLKFTPTGVLDSKTREYLNTLR